MIMVQQPTAQTVCLQCTKLDYIQDIPLNQVAMNFISFKCLDALHFNLSTV